MPLGGPLGATGGVLGGALTSVGIPRDGIPVYESDLRSERFQVIAHGTPGEAYRAWTLLTQTTPESLDHHLAGTPACPKP